MGKVATVVVFLLIVAAYLAGDWPERRRTEVLLQGGGNLASFCFEQSSFRDWGWGVCLLARYSHIS